MRKVLFLLMFPIIYFSQESDSIYVSKDFNKAIANIRTIKVWLNDDYLNNNIPRYIYDQFIIVLENNENRLNELNSKNEKKLNYLYSKVDINGFLNSFKIMKDWLIQDYSSGEISKKIYDEYNLVLNNTYLGFKMILSDSVICCSN